MSFSGDHTGSVTGQRFARSDAPPGATQASHTPRLQFKNYSTRSTSDSSSPQPPYVPTGPRSSRPATRSNVTSVAGRFRSNVHYVKVTTLEMVSRALPEVAVALRSCNVSENPGLYFLANLPAYGSLERIITKKQGLREFSMEAIDKRWQTQRIEAALAQAAGIPSTTQCNSCAGGNGLFTVCSIAPTRPAENTPIFSGCCSCAYFKRGCRFAERPKSLPSPSTALSSQNLRQSTRYGESSLQASGSMSPAFDRAIQVGTATMQPLRTSPPTGPSRSQRRKQLTTRETERNLREQQTRTYLEQIKQELKDAEEEAAKRARERERKDEAERKARSPTRIDVFSQKAAVPPEPSHVTDATSKTTSPSPAGSTTTPIGIAHTVPASPSAEAITTDLSTVLALTSGTSSTQPSPPAESSAPTPLSPKPQPPAKDSGSSSDVQGPLPRWAYFYDPPLTFVQAKFVETRMASDLESRKNLGEEYETLPLDERRRINIANLKKALASMREAFGRSTDVVRQSATSMPATTPAVAVIAAIKHPTALPIQGSSERSSAEQLQAGAISPEEDHSVPRVTLKPTPRPRSTLLKESPAENPTADQSIIVGLSSDDDHSVQCICKFYGDVATTVQCEECETWQHIACYYPGREEEAREDHFTHVCVNCQPERHQALDRENAFERMRAKLGPPRVGGRSREKSKPTKIRLNFKAKTSRAADTELAQESTADPQDDDPAAAPSRTSPPGGPTSNTGASNVETSRNLTSLKPPRAMPMSSSQIRKPASLYGADTVPAYRPSPRRHFGRPADSTDTLFGNLYAFHKRAASGNDLPPKRQKLVEDCGDGEDGVAPSHAHRRTSLQDFDRGLRPPETYQSSASQVMLPEADSGSLDASSTSTRLQEIHGIAEHGDARPEVLEPNARIFPQFSLDAYRRKHDAPQLPGDEYAESAKSAAAASYPDLARPRDVQVPNAAIDKDNTDVPDNSGTAMVRWFDEELQLLTKWRTQEKPWAEVFEAIPRHTRKAVQAKFWQLRREQRGGPSMHTAQDPSRRRPLYELPANGAAARTTLSLQPRTVQGPVPGIEPDLSPQNGANQPRKSQQPKEFTADSSGRLYHMLKGKYGRLETYPGLLLPGNYENVPSDLPGSPWVCPIRPCRFAFRKVNAMAKHFAISHRTCLLNDNNDGTFSITGEYTPKKKKRLAKAMVISRHPLDPREPPMEKTRSRGEHVRLQRVVEHQNVHGRTQGYTESRARGVDGKDQDPFTMLSSGKAVATSSCPAVSDPAMQEPSDMTMATDLRAYREWPDATGKLTHTWGVLLPVNYAPYDLPGFEWICPVRTCGRVMPSLKGLGGHFHSSHSSTLLNDNGDGTFSVIGSYNAQGPARSPALVRSKQPLSRHAPPQAKPNSSSANIQPQDFAVLLKKFEQHRNGWPEVKKPTVDEVLAGRRSSAPQTQREASASSALSPASVVHGRESSVSEAEIVPAEDSGATDVENPSDDGREYESLDVSGLTGHAKDNWASIQALSADKALQPPQSGILRELLALRRAREINVKPMCGMDIATPKDISLLIIQLTGQQPPKPCNRCSRGRGTFKECVEVTQEVADVIQRGACACTNCSWKGRYQKHCNVKAPRRADLSPAWAPRATPKSGARDTVVSDAGEDSDSHSDPPLRSRQVLGRQSTRNETGDTSDSDQSMRVRRSGRLLATGDSDGDQPLRASRPGTGSTALGDDSDALQSVEMENMEMEDVEPRPAAASRVVMRNMTQSTRVDEAFKFRMETILPGTSLRLRPDRESLRICALAVGRLVVKVQGEAVFEIGVQGMFKLEPGVRADVMNSSGVGAVLHVSCFRQGR